MQDGKSIEGKRDVQREIKMLCSTPTFASENSPVSGTLPLLVSEASYGSPRCSPDALGNSIGRLWHLENPSSPWLLSFFVPHPLCPLQTTSRQNWLTPAAADGTLCEG